MVQNSVKKFKSANKGITLIALVITIIVLLILAAISIATLTGDNGLLTKAGEAKTTTQEKSAKERVDLEVLASIGNDGKIDLEQLNENLKHIEGLKYKDAALSDTNKIESLPADVVVDGYTVTIKADGTTTGKSAGGGDEGIGIGNKAEDNGTVDGKDASYSNPIIPKGFKAIDVGEAKWGTADGYKNGLVIEDAVEGSETVGSQFVWVPVEDYENNFHLIEGYYNGGLDSELGNVKEAGSTSGTTPLASNNVAGTAESIAMYKSVKDNGGFYIARYEAGIDGTTENHSLSTKTVTNGDVKPLSKAGLGVWNSIAWGGTSAKEASDGLQGNDNANGAVKVARSMYNDSTKYGATSTLCYGVQWDAAMTFIDPNYSNGTYDANSYVKNSAGKGWYSDVANNTRHTTGYYAENNIYDLGGNVSEWTMEAYNTDDRVDRRRQFLLYRL